MLAQRVKRLSGFSSAEVWLMEGRNGLFVRKSGEISRNLEAYANLNNKLRLPKVLLHGDGFFDMEFIAGLDAYSYVTRLGPDALLRDIFRTVTILSSDSQNYDFRTEIDGFLSSFPHWPAMPFGREELLSRIPSQLPRSGYHGDFTIDNMVYDSNGHLVLLDPVTHIFQSWVFDLAKLRQDLEGGWTAWRRGDWSGAANLGLVATQLQQSWAEFWDDSFYILMLMRILRRARNSRAPEFAFLTQEINRLWK